MIIVKRPNVADLSLIDGPLYWGVTLLHLSVFILQGMFEPYLKGFFVHSNDPTHIRLLKVGLAYTCCMWSCVIVDVLGNSDIVSVSSFNTYSKQSKYADVEFKIGFWWERRTSGLVEKDPLKELRKYVIHIQQIKGKLVIHFVAGILLQA